MKILHTSDWHLGQSFFTKSRKNEHAAFLAWLLTQVEQHAIDAVIVAGDIFDTGTPPSYAREMYNQFVVDLQRQHCVLVVLGGNHDSVSMLNESRQLLGCLNTHVIASTGLALEEQVLTIAKRPSTQALDSGDGEIGAVVCAVPFIRPRDVMVSQAGESATDKRQALGEAIKQHYASVYQLAVAKRDQLGGDLPIIATGHLTALGVTQSDSVRDIYIGTLEGFAADGFPPADYIALGHIHRPQVVAKSEHIRYSGSPIALSFDELNSQKNLVMVEFEGAKRKDIQLLPVPIFQPMAVVKGDLPSIQQQLLDLATPASEETNQLPVWLCVEVESQDYLSDLQQRIQGLTEGLNVEVLQLKRVRNTKRQLLSQAQTETLSELSPTEVFDKRLAMETFDSEEEQERRARISMAFHRVLNEVETEGDDA